MENFKEELRLILETKTIIQAKSYGDLQIVLVKFLDDEEFSLSLSDQMHNLINNACQVLEKYTSIIFNQIQ